MNNILRNFFCPHCGTRGNIEEGQRDLTVVTPLLSLEPTGPPRRGEKTFYDGDTPNYQCRGEKCGKTIKYGGKSGLFGGEVLGLDELVEFLTDLADYVEVGLVFADRTWTVIGVIAQETAKDLDICRAVEEEYVAGGGVNNIVNSFIYSRNRAKDMEMLEEDYLGMDPDWEG